MSNMLETYSLDFTGKKDGKKDYDLKFKVAKKVNVTFKQVGDISEIHLNHDSTSSKVPDHKNYKVSGALRIQFFQHPAVSAGKDGGDPGPVSPDPDIRVQP